MNEQELREQIAKEIETSYYHEDNSQWYCYGPKGVCNCINKDIANIVRGKQL
jgi:hypothetical protein